jgi:hypothetical protein
MRIYFVIVFHLPVYLPNPSLRKIKTLSYNTSYFHTTLSYNIFGTIPAHRPHYIKNSNYHLVLSNNNHREG